MEVNSVHETANNDIDRTPTTNQNFENTVREAVNRQNEEIRLPTSFTRSRGLREL